MIKDISLRRGLSHTGNSDVTGMSTPLLLSWWNLNIQDKNFVPLQNTGRRSRILHKHSYPLFFFFSLQCIWKKEIISVLFKNQVVFSGQKNALLLEFYHLPDTDIFHWDNGLIYRWRVLIFKNSSFRIYQVYWSKPSLRKYALICFFIQYCGKITRF